MKQPKLSDLVMDSKGTRELRSKMQKTKKVKITINIDESSLGRLREIAEETGASYQKLLNQILKDGLAKRTSAESRLERLEKEIQTLKKKIAA
jgi:predicted DNA binding CopG/RHH family protein